MSEHEKFEQVGRLAEEYSKLKGELNHVTEKINHAREAYQIAFQAMQSGTIVVREDGEISIHSVQPYRPIPNVLHALLNFHELQAVYVEQRRLAKELGEATTRLRALAPHLV